MRRTVMYPPQVGRRGNDRQEQKAPEGPASGAPSGSQQRAEPVEPADPLLDDEARMRRALGISGNGSRITTSGGDRPQAQGGAFNPAHVRRHRFVQDGEVKVTLARRGEHLDAGSAGAAPINRLEALQASLASEKAARAAAERSLEEAQAAVRDLQTKLAHMELARDEALIQSQARASALALAEAELAAIARAKAEADAPPKEPAAEAPTPAPIPFRRPVGRPRRIPLEPGATPPVKRPVGRPRRALVEAALNKIAETAGLPPPAIMLQPEVTTLARRTLGRPRRDTLEAERALAQAVLGHPDAPETAAAPLEIPPPVAPPAPIVTPAAIVTTAQVKRPVGRPRRVVAPVAEVPVADVSVADVSVAEPPPPAKRPVGRPRREAAVEIAVPAKRPVGRPRREPAPVSVPPKAAKGRPAKEAKPVKWWVRNKADAKAKPAPSTRGPRRK